MDDNKDPNTCATCCWWDCGLCDRVGYMTDCDDHCPYYNSSVDD